LAPFYAAGDSRRGKFRALGALFLALSVRCFRSSWAPFFGAPSRRALGLSGSRSRGSQLPPVGRVAVAVAFALRPSVRGSRGSRGSRPRRGGECSGYLTREKRDLWKSQGLSTRYPQPPVDNPDFEGRGRVFNSLSVAIRTLSVAAHSLSVAAEINPAVS